MQNSRNTEHLRLDKEDHFLKGFSQGFEEGFLGFLYPFAPRNRSEDSTKIVHTTGEKSATIIIKTNTRRKTT